MSSIKLFYLVISVFLSISCNIQSKRGSHSNSTNNKYLLPAEEIKQEVSLKSDLEFNDPQRENVPTTTKTFNSETAFILDLFTDPSVKPARIQSKFDKKIRQKENAFRKIMRKQRSQYSKQERNARENFLDKINKEREIFNKDRHDTNQRKEFYDSQDEKRKDYFANERDRRKDFESQARDLENDTNANFRDLRSYFREEMRVYRNKHREWEKQKKSSRVSPTRTNYNSNKPTLSPSLQEEFDELEKVKAEKLKAE